MQKIFGMVMLLVGAAALPAAATVNGLASFPMMQSPAPQGPGLLDFGLLDFGLAGSSFSDPSFADTGLPDSGLPLILVQSTGGGNSPEKADRPDPYTTAPPRGTPADAVGISPAATAALVAALSDGNKQCARLKDSALNIDCLSYQYWLAAQNLSWKDGYGSARTALLRAADRLHTLAQANADPNQPAVRVNLGGKPTQRKLTPVRMTPQVAAQATAIVEETKLVLLRSSEGSEQRRTAYVQVAAIVGSSKVLLRSS
jgi:hypothetical protein